MGDKEDINWKQEIAGAGVPTTHDILAKYQSKFNNHAIDKYIKDRMENIGNRRLKELSLNKLKFKTNAYDVIKKTFGLEKVFNIKSLGKYGKVGVGPLDAIFLFKGIYDVWTDEDSSTGQKIYDTGKEVAGAVGGAVAGAALGTLLAGPLGTFVGGLIGSIGGSFLAKLAYDSIGNKIKYYAGILGQFLSGGVEFSLPKPIQGFENNLIFDRCHYIAFEYNDDNNFNINQIIDLVNSKFLLGNLKFKNITEVYDTILKEIAYGFLFLKKLPEISLNFNKEALLYSIMDNFYKNTITGNVLTFLDYYLKSYVNGGFFKEEFIYQWQDNKNTNRDYLQKNIVDFKKYLYDLTNDPNKINYCSMYDLGQTSENEHNYVSAFRIIGNIQNNLKYYKNILFPKCSYFTQYDFDILPSWQSKINVSDEEKQTAESLEHSHKIMNARVKYLMKEIPFLKPYFELLKMITFAIHYLPNIQKCGLFPIFKDAIQNNYIGEKYCRSIPKVFPPLPIRKRTTLKVKISMKELLDLFKINNYQELNQFILVCFYETEEKSQIQKAIEKQSHLLNKIKSFVKQKVISNLDEQDKYIINFFSDEKLSIKSIEKDFIDDLFDFPRLEVIKDYYAIYYFLKKQDNKMYKPKNPEDYITKVTSFIDLKKEVEEILNIFGIYIIEFFQEQSSKLTKEESNFSKLIEEKKQNEMKKLVEEFNKMIREKCNNNEAEMNQIKNKPEIKNLLDEQKRKLILDFDKKKQDLILKNRNSFENKKKEIDNLIDRLKASLDNLQNKLIYCNLINENSIKNNVKIQKDALILTLSYTKALYEEKKENEKYFPIRGGCLPKINNNVFLNEIEEFNEKLYHEFIKHLNNTKKNKQKKYYVVKTELRNGFIYGDALDYFTRIIDKNKKIMEISCAFDKKINNNIKDFSGNSLGFYKTLANSRLDILPTREELNCQNNFGERPELFLLSSDNISYVKKLISLPYSNFSSQLEGGLTPLSSALIGGEKNVVTILLSRGNIVKNGDLNISNELGITYLHLAVTTNMDNAVKALIENGADISLITRKEANSPIHLMGILGRNEIILSIYRNQQFIHNLNKQRPDGKTALHFMSSNSILGTKLFLLAGGDSKIFDTFGNTPARYAFFSGRFDIYDLLIKNSNFKQDIYLKNNLENMISNSYKNKNLEFKLKFDKNKSYLDLIKFYEINDIKNCKAVINIFKKEKIDLSDKKIYELIELSCKIRNIELLKLLFELKSLKNFHIGPYIGKYGLISWLSEMANFGIDIFTKSEKILDNNDIYDFCVLNDDKKLLKHLFKLIDKPTKDFENVISRIFCKAVILSKINILHQLKKELEINKFKEFQISLNLLSKDKNLTLNKLKKILNGYPKVLSKTFDIHNVVKYCRPNILDYMIENKIINKDEDLLENLIYSSIENDRFDNLFTLIKNYPKLSGYFLNVEDVNKKLIEIEELLQEKNDFGFGLERIWQNQLNEKVKDLKIGFLKLPINNMYLPHLIIQSRNLWAFNCLKTIYGDDVFFYDDELNTCFDYLLPNRNIDKVSFEDLDTIIKYFGTKFDKILKVIEIFTDNLKESNINCGDEYLKYLFSSFPFEFYEAYNENYNSIFHIITNIKINSNECKLIIEKLKALKVKNIKAFKFILNLQDMNGDTFLMLFLQNENYEISIQILDIFYEEIQINLFNRLGNSILHSLFLNKNFNKISNNFIIYEKIYEILLKILSKNKTLILYKNREHNTPYALAANSGCNLALTIMSNFYSIEYLESFSDYSPALHLACINEDINTVRFLIEYSHYDPNKKLLKNGKKNLHYLPEGSTPLHCAAYASSKEIFEYLLLHGSDPFIENINKKDAFDLAYKNGNYEFLKYIFNLKSSKLYSSNDKYLLSIIQNTQKGSYEIFENYIDINTFQNFNIVDDNMNTLLILACKVDNPEFISTLINNGIDPLIKNQYGNTCLHICTYSNSFSCAGLVLSKLESNKEYEKIKEILNIKNNSGDTPLHIAAENNFETISLLFISYLIRNNIELEMIKNSSGLTPVQLAIKKHNYKIAITYINYLNLNISEILELKNMNISKEFDDFIYCYDSGLLKENEVYINNKFSNIKYHMQQREKIPKGEEKKYLEDIKPINGFNYNDWNEGIKYKSYIFLSYNIEKYYKCDLLTEELFFNYKNILGNMPVILTLINWAKNSNKNLIESYLQILIQLNVSNKKFLIENNNSENNELYKIVELISIVCIPYINRNNIIITLKFLQKLVTLLETKGPKENNSFLKFIKNSIISYFDSPFIKPDIKIFFNEVLKFIEKIIFDDEFVHNFNYTSSAFKTYEFLFKLNSILDILPDRGIQLCQIKNLNNIPCVFDEEIPKLLNKYHILHEYILKENIIYNFSNSMLSKKNKNLGIIDEVLFITKMIDENNELSEDEKISIIKNSKYVYEKYIKDKKFLTDEFSSFINNFYLLSAQIILNNGLKSYESIFNEIITQINSYEDIIPYIYIYSSPKEIVFPNLEQKLNDILSKIQLTENDKVILSKIAMLIPQYCEKYKYIKEFKNLGIKFGKEFKNNPNYDNLSKLISLVSLGVANSMNMTPYLIQCLSVSSFLLHYLEIKKNKNYNFKGKLAQIKTGEGKSLIIAMLSLANALIGNFVDVITSTHYLAERDQIKFKKFYELFGVSSSNIIKSNPPKSDYNGIIIYGTNTDFEFSLLREGINMRKKLYTVPLNTTDNSLIERTYDVAIVDECDNLFLDTARNSARISHPAKCSFNWIYPLIYKYFTENEHNLNVKNLRKVLLEYENGKYKLDLEKITDDKLKELFKSAKIAKEKKLNLDYVIGFDEETSKKQIQIVSLDTGRIQHGSRWTSGIHELIEVKEGIEPETESNIIGSISHPTYFENYSILFGLTGTIGDEIERKEIEEIYKIKCYDIPRNFREKLISEELEICENKKEKYNKILKIIKDNKNKNEKAQPILVILENIEETLEFGKLLSDLQFSFFTLNDIQKENEDYILNNTGHSGSILIATNAAGRGTDIIIDEKSKQNGGLYVIVGFFPKNSRIEFQAVGRAGRQGNPGKAKIIISKDEEFIYYNYYFINQLKSIVNNEMEAYYLFRKMNVEDISKTRIEFCKKERIFFYNLKKYFIFKEFIASLLNNNLFKSYYQDIVQILSTNISFEYYKNYTLMNLDNIWSEFYSDFNKERGNRNYIISDKNDYFVDFLRKFENDWLNCLKEIYKDNDKKKFDIDLILKAIKNIIEIIIRSNKNAKNGINDYKNFKDLLIMIQLSELLK